MNKFLYRFIIIFSSLLLLAAVLGAILIYIDNSSDLIVLSNSASDKIELDVSQSLNKGYGPDTDEFRDLTSALFKKYPTLFSLTIFSHEKGIYFLKTASPEIIKTELLSPSRWKGVIPYTDRVKNEIFLKRDLNLPGIVEKLQIEAGFGKSLTQKNYKLSLIFFFVIAALLVFTIFALIFSDSASEAKNAPPAETGSAIQSDDNQDKKVIRTPAPQGIGSAQAPSAKIRNENPAGTVVKEPPSAAEGLSSGELRPSSGFCIYSERTGLIKKDLLIDKLDQELIRSASFDQDLVLVIFSIRGLNEGTIPEFKKIINESFPYKDLVFEYDEDSFAIIIPNIDIESSVAEIESFQRKIEKAGFSKEQKFSAGVSSRSGRLLKGERLLLEASRSQKRSVADKTGGILLFRISPRKYRQIVSQKGY